MRTRKDCEPPTKLEKIRIRLTSYWKRAEHFAHARFEEARETHRLTDLALMATTQKGFNERKGKVERADTIIKVKRVYPLIRRY